MIINRHHQSRMSLKTLFFCSKVIEWISTAKAIQLSQNTYKSLHLIKEKLGDSINSVNKQHLREYNKQANTLIITLCNTTYLVHFTFLSTIGSTINLGKLATL